MPFSDYQERKRTLKVGHLARDPALRHAVELGALAEHDVLHLAAEGRASDIERAKCDGRGRELGEKSIGTTPLVLAEGEEEAPAVGEEQLESDVAEQVFPFVDLDDLSESKLISIRFS